MSAEKPVPKLAIFDMDGVLADTEPVYGRMYAEVYRRFGLELPAEERDSFIGRATAHIWNFVREKYSLTAQLSELIALKEKVYGEMLRAEKLEPIQGVVELLDYLRAEGFTLAIASSSKREIIEYITTAIGIRSRFSFISSGDAVTKGKPDPEIFLKVSAYFGCDPSSCFVIEDSGSGVRGAKAAGMTVFAFRNPNSGVQDLSSADSISDRHEDIITRFRTHSQKKS
jgi:HAD superfamily hydrolase (TIGR01509 family)